MVEILDFIRHVMLHDVGNVLIDAGEPGLGRPAFGLLIKLVAELHLVQDDSLRRVTR